MQNTDRKIRMIDVKSHKSCMRSIISPWDHSKVENEVNVVNLLHVAYEFCTFIEGAFCC